MAEDIQVAMATDRNYLDYALVAAASLLAQHPGGGITLHLLHEELDESDFARFEELRRIDGFQLVPRKIERGFFQGWPELRWSTSAYYRLIRKKSSIWTATCWCSTISRNSGTRSSAAVPARRPPSGWPRNTRKRSGFPPKRFTSTPA